MITAKHRTDRLVLSFITFIIIYCQRVPHDRAFSWITWNNVPSNGEVLYAADFVSVKEEPNDTSSTVGELGPGNQIQVLNRDDNGWATIVFNGATTYIPSSYLSDIDPQTMTQAAPTQPIGNMVWLSATGSKYHSRNNCGNMNPANARQVTESDAVSQGYEKCKKCW